MKDKTENKIFIALKQLAPSATTTQIAEQIGLSRAVTSNYLNKLNKKNIVTKEGRRPVYWSFTSKQQKFANESEKQGRQEKGAHHHEDDVFRAFIGACGSQKKVIQQCKAAITYPPNGLPILITGESGVGKSFLASLIYNYAKQTQIISKNAPFKVLNCADYANNPELLSGMLFGYKKGSFTGAENDRPGILDYADGGYLFLDEIHRLSYENQEKLFVFMDKGHYFRLGESERWRHAKVRLIFATTENSNTILLETFRRRISVKLVLAGLNQRYEYEKIALIRLFYSEEAKRLNRQFRVDDSVLQLLSSGQIEGNIGGIRNAIQLSCANAFVKDRKNTRLEITLEEMPQIPAHLFERNAVFNEIGLIVDPNNQVTDFQKNPVRQIHLIENLNDFIQKLKDLEASGPSSELIFAFNKLSKTIMDEQHRGWIISPLWSDFLYDKTHREMTQFFSKYGITEKQPLVQKLLLYMEFFNSFTIDLPEELDLPQVMNMLRIKYPKAIYLVSMWKQKNQLFKEISGDMIDVFYILSIHDQLDDKVNLSGLLIAHGNSTASSIQEVVNRMYGTFVFEAFDMPITSSVSDIVVRVRDYLRYFNRSKGLILIVDMGSLGRLYATIKHDIKGDLLIINNLTTSIALDVGIKMINDVPFKEISVAAAEDYKVKTQYFEAVEKNIMISCMSGMGIAERIKEILSSFIYPDKLRLITLEYKEIQELFSRQNTVNISNTVLLITTTDLDQKNLNFPCLNIYDTLRDNGEQMWEILESFMNRDSFQQMMKQLVTFFSIEGVAARLEILNPNIVIAESETIISNFESYYSIRLNGFERINIFMHLSMMFERLILNHGERNVDDFQSSNASEHEQEFFKVALGILNSAEKKFNITITHKEVHLLYVLLKRII
ncbi:sigma 54-interacting transcriptional regulator [Sporolactobacillus shoreicorticis]|uniref:Sigma 54-interacting transcriptional regulator n=1 Tax=Sporolactobacillus shoreicorticis TaxID=1923877 RepID=A0ABW5S050_9BACL|nr:sigma 54-interacting transcriptional regulator [Sporolactobacillus shoreicorticis]MCO7124702.1 sigma 54-interacting transcriptional regulator [Sporolactobacillus shoreicorticis]